MDFEAFLNQIRSSPAYRNQIVHTHIVEPRDAQYRDTNQPIGHCCSKHLKSLGIEHLYSHQAEAVNAAREGSDVLVVTGTASGKSLCYQLPLLEMIEKRPAGRAIILHPTKALSQDQFQAFRRALGSAEMTETLVGVFDGDTPANMRRKLRDEASLILTNPDMLHAALLTNHTRWADFLRNLKFVIVDEMHTYSGLFGSNAANLFRRLERVCSHYGARPQFIFCSATVGNPREVAKKLTGRNAVLIDNDGSPRGKKTFIFWNPPRIRQRRFRSRRSANVEAQELMSELIVAQIPTITFSKAKVTAELIYRYVVETLERSAPHLARKVTPYRGGYLPEERREIERKLFSGELLGVSTTRALELGIDVGGLDASIIVGYPGTLAAFFQQAGRSGRRDRESLAILVGIDTAVNQYVMKHPEYIFGKPIERIVLDPDNPYVLSGQLRCAAYELPISEDEAGPVFRDLNAAEIPKPPGIFGRYARIVLDVLTEQKKLNKVGSHWYHASDDVPEHEVSLRDVCDANVAITDVDTGRVIGELNKYDAQPIIHPQAIYLHQGDTYLVLELDLDRNLCLVKRVETDYYTQPLGGTDVHHIDQPLRERRLGAAKAYFGEVTAYFTTNLYERIHFYNLDAVSRHEVNIPTYQLETMALWIAPREEVVREMVEEGLDVHKGLMGIGYAMRMILPLFIQCETLDFSHSSCTAINAPWHTMFVYERYPHGLGFTEQAFEMLGDLILAVYDTITKCGCRNGCPCCIGKPLRGYTTWNIERGEANIPSKRAALRILRDIIGDGTSIQTQDDEISTEDDKDKRLLIERGIRRRLERLTDPEVFHPIEPKPEVGFPDIERPAVGTDADIARRAMKRLRIEKLKEPGEDSAAQTPELSRPARDFDAKTDPELAHEVPSPAPRSGSKALRDLMRRKPDPQPAPASTGTTPVEETPKDGVEIKLGDSIAAKARRLRKEKA